MWSREANGTELVMAGVGLLFRGREIDELTSDHFSARLDKSVPCTTRNFDMKWRSSSLRVRKHQRNHIQAY